MSFRPRGPVVCALLFRSAYLQPIQILAVEQRVYLHTRPSSSFDPSILFMICD